MLPQDVEKTVNAQWYERWLILNEARTSRTAWAVRNRTDADKWADLPKEILDAMNWAFETEHG